MVHTLVHASWHHITFHALHPHPTYTLTLIVTLYPSPCHTLQPSPYHNLHSYHITSDTLYPTLHTLLSHVTPYNPHHITIYTLTISHLTPYTPHYTPYFPMSHPTTLTISQPTPLPYHIRHPIPLTTHVSHPTTLISHLIPYIPYHITPYLPPCHTLQPSPYHI